MTDWKLKEGERLDDLVRDGMKLIQRPDQFCFSIDSVLLAHYPAIKGRDKICDLGTGTGAIALALASDRPAWQVTAVDRVEEAAALAERNRQRLGLGNAQVRVSHWFDSLAGERFDLIVSNPPYIAAADPHLVAGDVRFEPSSALVAGADGLDDLRVIAAQAPAHLLPGGWLLLEHGYDQAASVRALLAEQGFIEVASRTDLGGHERITLGRLPC